ncbi:hypothetical protein PPACK8108_LOCUS21428 [Phakopsora pachyrhizi]|uniref:Uncharacterized protein n=1 Tax=Phakopsora pachyrhizi TaxID=170000 RepID=A0AAV0BJJ3_PHAPC|nr:hypothetical protein PPACK8108_LOCUS21428 [Phakopsora pachyrhizi]
MSTEATQVAPATQPANVTEPSAPPKVEQAPAPATSSTTDDITNSNTAGPAQKNKFDNVGKTVGSKVKTVFSTIHALGEQLRGNINAALDGAGDAIANRKHSTVTSRSANTSATESAPAANTTAPTNTTAPAPATSAEPSTVAPPVAAADAAQPKRTVTLVQRVTGNLRSNANRTIVSEIPLITIDRKEAVVTYHVLLRSMSLIYFLKDSFGNSISQRKQQASKRFSRRPAPVGEEATVTATPQDVPTVSSTTPAETVPPQDSAHVST